MKRLRVAARRVAGLFGRDQDDADLREELESLAALQVDEQMAAGLDAAEARRRVLARTGSVTAVQEAVREQRMLGWLDGLARDLRVGLRMLRRNPVFATTAILSLALGIGANSAIFSIVDHLLLRALPVAHADRLLMLDGGAWTYPIFEQVKARADEFDGAGAWTDDDMVTHAAGTNRRETTLYVSGGFFELLGVAPALGRTIGEDDDRRGGGSQGPVAVISDAYWARAFGRDPSVLGRTVIVERVPYTVVGVTPRGFLGPEVGRSFSIAIPFGTETLVRGSQSRLDERRFWWINILIRRRADQTEAQVAAALRAMQPAIREATRTPDPEYLREPLGVVSAEQGRSVLRGRYRDALWVLMGASVVVLLITCANVANLLLARTAARRAEMAVRVALGGPRRRLVQQLLIESAILSAMGAVAGLMFAIWTARLIVSQLSATAAPAMLDVALDWRIALFAAAVAAVVTPLFAVLPALRATQLEPADAIKERARTVMGDRSHGLGQALVLGQIAASLVLVVLAGLLVGTFTKLANRPLGLASERVVVAAVSMQPDTLPTDEQAELFERLRHIVAAVPGVAEASLAFIAPVSGAGWSSAVVDVDGTDVGGDARHRLTSMNGVTDGFFTTYGVEMHDGRDFSVADTAAAPAVMIVNDAFVRRFLGGGPAVGRRVRSGVHGRPDTYGHYREIIGVVADTVSHPRRDVEPTAFIPLWQVNGLIRDSITIGARARAGDADTLVGPVRQALEAADARTTASVFAHQAFVRTALTQERLVAAVAGLFGGLALLLAVVGLYGVTAYTVSRRRSEIGVRLALGATPPRVLRLVLARVAALVAAGIVLGVGLSLWAGEAVRVLLHGLEPNDPVTLAGGAAVLLVTGGIAGAIPAWRAARTHPAVALRE